jgi:hypothetical protein
MVKKAAHCHVLNHDLRETGVDGLPIAAGYKSASLSMFCSARSANFSIQAERWAPVDLLHGPVLKAIFAVEAAASISSGPAIWTSGVTMESSYGLQTVRVSLDFDVTH